MLPRLLASKRLRGAVRLALWIVLILAVRSSIASAYWVPTGSMIPTLLPGDRFVASKWSYGLRVPFTDVWVTRPEMPARGEIVVFPSPIDGVDLVKRVVAVAGDTVEVRGGRLVLNGRELALEPAGRDADGAELFIEALGDVRHVVRRLPGSRRHGDLRPFVVPEGAFFAMGDNRDNSADSRVFGAVPVTSLRGRARRLLFSIDAERSPYVRLGRTGGALR